MRFALFLLLLLAALPLLAESRSWRSANGNRSFRAEFVSSDGKSVTLKQTNQKMVTVALKNLHPHDRTWVLDRIKKVETKTHGGLKSASFDTLVFGDSRKIVQEKLTKSAVVTKSIDDRLVGRTGLNGIYQTTIGEDPYDLFFHWTEEDELKEVTLRSKTLGEAEYDKTLKKTWTALAALLLTHHGKPIQTTTYPVRTDLADAKLLGSHLWHTKDKHSILLSTGQEGAGYLVAIRFSAELIPPNKLSEEPKDTPPPKTEKKNT